MKLYRYKAKSVLVDLIVDVKGTNEHNVCNCIVKDIIHNNAANSLIGGELLQIPKRFLVLWAEPNYILKSIL